ncbi:MAG TPA: hypothetical protein VF800_14780 [Telluria sp.]|jgi:hypothetical protein
MKARSLMPASSLRGPFPGGPFLRRARGIAHIELALLLSTMAFLLPLIFSMGRILYVYMVLRQSTATVATYLATLPQAEWNSNAVMGNPMRNKVFLMAENALLDAGVAPAIPLFDAGYFCNGDSGTLCGGERQEMVSVTLQVHMPVSYMIMSDLGMGETLTVKTTVTVPYAR